MNNKMKFLALLLSFISIGSVVACNNSSAGSVSSSEVESSIPSSSSPEESEKVELSLNKTQVTLVEDEMEVLFATSNASKNPTWTSSDESVATVSVVGKIIAKTAGTTVITAQIGKTTAQCMVTVVEAPKKTKDYIDVESTAYLSLDDENTPKILPSYMVVEEDGERLDSDKTFTFTSLNESVATVDEEGVITAVSLGKADIEVRCGDIVTYVVADVYTDLIVTEADWLTMLGRRELFARYYLACDLDFTGVEYNIEKYFAREKGFCGELNGGRHTVSNVTVTGNTGTEGQSLFGGAKCVNIYDVAFYNVTYTSSKSSGLCSSLMQHVNISNHPEWIISGNNVWVDGRLIEGATVMREGDKIIFPAKVNNVIVDAQFIGHGNVGFCKSFYGGLISNVYINMRRGDDQAFNETDFMFAQTLHIWYFPNAASNTIVRIDKGVLTESMSNVDSYSLPLSDVTYTTDEILANYKAYQMFDKSIWSITPKGIPTFVK